MELAMRWLAALALAFVLVAGCGRPRPAAPPASPSRLVALSPSCVEVVCSLGLGDRLVGIDSFTRYPPEICDRPRLGGLLDANFEALVALKPDLVVLPASHEAGIRKLRQMGIATLPMSHDSMEGILASVRAAGVSGGCPERGEALAASLEKQLREAAARHPAGAPRPRVLVCVGRDYGAHDLREVYAAGREKFYSILLEAAGGADVLADALQPFPKLSRENLVNLDPDIIIDVVSGAGGRSPAELATAWSSLGDLKAVKSGRIHVLTVDYATVPGPRFPLLLADFERIIQGGSPAGPAPPAPISR